MQNCGAYVLVLKNDRKVVFENEVYWGKNSFAEPVPTFSGTSYLLCFISTLPGKITHIAEARQGRIRAGTGLSKLKLEKIMTLTSPIPIASILLEAPIRVKRFISQYFASGGLLPPKTCEVCIEIFLRLLPETADLLNKFSAARAKFLNSLPDATKAALSTQKEAVYTALKIAQIPSGGWNPPVNKPIQSFLDGVPGIRQYEDAMIIHDLHQLPGFQEVKSLPHPSVLYENDSIQLTVILANKLPLELQTGTDLIYYNETYQSFVLGSVDI